MCSTRGADRFISSRAATLRISWTATAAAAAPLMGYAVSFGTVPFGSQLQARVFTSNTSLQVPTGSFAHGMSVWVSVEAYDAAGNIGASSELIGRIDALPPIFGDGLSAAVDVAVSGSSISCAIDGISSHAMAVLTAKEEIEVLSFSPLWERPCDDAIDVDARAAANSLSAAAIWPMANDLDSGLTSLYW